MGGAGGSTRCATGHPLAIELGHALPPSHGRGALCSTPPSGVRTLCAAPPGGGCALRPARPASLIYCISLRWRRGGLRGRRGAGRAATGGALANLLAYAARPHGVCALPSAAVLPAVPPTPRPPAASCISFFSLAGSLPRVLAAPRKNASAADGLPSPPPRARNPGCATPRCAGRAPPPRIPASAGAWWLRRVVWTLRRLRRRRHFQSGLPSRQLSRREEACFVAAPMPLPVMTGATLPCPYRRQTPPPVRERKRGGGGGAHHRGRLTWRTRRLARKAHPVGRLVGRRTTGARPPGWVTAPPPLAPPPHRARVLAQRLQPTRRAMTRHRSAFTGSRSAADGSAPAPRGWDRAARGPDWTFSHAASRQGETEGNRMVSSRA